MKMGLKSENVLSKGIMGAFMILLMHVALIGLIGALVIFFGWFINYFGWIMLVIGCSLAGSLYWFYKKTKADGEMIKKMLGDSLLKGKNVEVSFLGGAATFKIEDKHSNELKIGNSSESVKQLEDHDAGSVRSLTELARLYEKKLITTEEYEKAKEKILK